MTKYPEAPVLPADILLTDRVAIVTGAAAGIGRAVSEQLAVFGAFVFLFDKDLSGAGDTLAAVRKAGGDGAAVEVDMRNETSLVDAIRSAAGLYGRLDILVNNAGVYPRAPFTDIPDALWQEVFDVNLRAAYIAMREASALMNEGGAIINVSSVDSLRPSAVGLGLYGASKAALNALTRSAAVELGPLGIRVNAVLPGVIATRDLPPDHPAYQVWGDRAPARRVGMPFDIASAVLFLAGPLAQFVHGQMIAADGGLTATA